MMVMVVNGWFGASVEEQSSEKKVRVRNSASKAFQERLGVLVVPKRRRGREREREREIYIYIIYIYIIYRISLKYP